MASLRAYFDTLTIELAALSTPEKAQASRRYFAADFSCIGANATDIKQVTANFHLTHQYLSPAEVLAISEYILAHSHFNEQKLLAFGLINIYVKHHFDDQLLLRFEYWLEHYCDNWSLVYVLKRPINLCLVDRI